MVIIVKLFGLLVLLVGMREVLLVSPAIAFGLVLFGIGFALMNYRRPHKEPIK